VSQKCFCNPLSYLCAVGHTVNKYDLNVVFTAVSRKNHTLAFNAAKYGGFKVRDYDNLFADKVLGLIPFCNTRSDCSLLSAAVIKREFKKLFSPLYRLAVLDLGDP
jgi:hypothetical protein